MRLVFVTGNAGKLQEAAAALPGIDVVADGRGYPEVQADTLADVTEAGARHLIAAGLEPPFILEDAGLFIGALRGFPGVYSRHAHDTIGLHGILRLMQDLETEMRAAAFAADVAYVDAHGTVHHHAGTVAGRIAEAPRGTGGFGFDPIFVPAGQARTFAEMDAAQKGRISHRGRTLASLARQLGARRADPPAPPGRLRGKQQTDKRRPPSSG